MQTATLGISGMTCGGRVRSVEEAGFEIAP